MVGGTDRRGAPFGLIGDLLIGIVGFFIGDWLLPQLGIHLGVGIVAAIINATIGAVKILLIIAYSWWRPLWWWLGWGRR